MGSESGNPPTGHALCAPIGLMQRAGTLLLALLGAPACGFAQQGEAGENSQIRATLEDEGVAALWLDDIDRAFEQAHTSGKPLLVNLRCVP